MKLKVLVAVLLLCSGLWGSFTIHAHAMDNQQKIFFEFTRALYKKDERTVYSLLFPTVQVPELKEWTPITGYSKLPSPHPNKMVILAHFQKDNDIGIQRIAFIWEITLDQQKISNIHVVSDGSNPLMNEQILTKEYREKNHKEILVPSDFPFKITHVSGEVKGKELNLYYSNNALRCRLSIEVQPMEGGKKVADKHYQPIPLQNGLVGILKGIPSGYELVLIQENLQYNVTIESENKEYRPTKKALISTVESMFPRGLD